MGWSYITPAGNEIIRDGEDVSDRTNLTPFDFRVQDEGTIVILHPLNDAARSWIDERLYGDGDTPMWWGGGVVIDHGMLDAIADGITDEGLTIQ